MNSGIQPRVYAIVESNKVDRELLQYFGTSLDEASRENAINQLNGLLDCLHDAKEYGSIISVPEYDFKLLREYVSEFDAQQNIFASGNMEPLQEKLQDMIDVGELLARKYEVVVTNPPYMGASGMGEKLSKYVKEKYPDSKSDLFAVFIEVCRELTQANGFQAMITQHSWMFLSSFEKLRKKLCEVDIINMAHLGPRAFEEIGGEVVQTTAFALKKLSICDYKGTYCRLIEPTTQQGKEDLYLSGSNRYEANQENFSKIPGSPIAYWVSDRALKCFEQGISVNDISDFTGSQHKTADNDRFLRYHWEIDSNDIKKQEWIFYTKGGEYRKWYGNIDLVVDWRDTAKSFYVENPTSNMIKKDYWFKHGITYTSLSSSTNGFRYLPACGVFDIKGPSLVNVDNLSYVLGFFNSKIAQFYLKLLNPTITLQVKDVKNTPLLLDVSKVEEVDEDVDKNIQLSRSDWDSFETSWDFQKHPMIMNVSRISDAYTKWSDECAERFEQLKANEEELNRIFIDIYGLQDELRG